MKTIKDTIPSEAWHLRLLALQEEITRELLGWKPGMKNIFRVRQDGFLQLLMPGVLNLMNTRSPGMSR